MNTMRFARLGFFLFLTHLLLVGCGTDKVRPAGEFPSGLKKLEGSWIRVTRSGMVYEVWKKSENSEFLGETWRVSGGDSVLTEKMRLFISEDSLYYGATVTEQNEGKEILFTLTAEGQEFIFENPAHNFPQRIRYSFPKKDELRVVIEDMGGEKRMFFNFFIGS